MKSSFTMSTSAAVIFAACSWFFVSPRAHAILDLNENLMSDVWEKSQNDGELFSETFVAEDDPDSDGWTNAQEAAAGTDPFDPNPPDGLIQPHIAHIAAVLGVDENENPIVVTPEAVTVSWPTIVGKQYTLLFSPDLSENGWLTVGDAFIGDGDEVLYTFLVSDSDSRFWRVAVTDADSDGDNLTDAEEIAFGLDPSKPQSLSGIPDLWLATHFTDILLVSGVSAIDPNADPDNDGASTLEELLAGTDPKVADAPNLRHWIAVHGNGAEDEVVTRTGTLTIPAGTSALLIVAIASDEYPDWTQGQSEYDDLLEWTATPSQGTLIQGSINVNERHSAWNADLTAGISLPGLPSPVHLEETHIFTAPSGENLTIDVSVSATNISDNILPSHIALGLAPVVVEFQALKGFDNLDAHIDPWGDHQQKGLRIFPDLKTPDDPVPRYFLQVKAKTSPVLHGKELWVKSFDVDDSTSEDFDHDLREDSPTYDEPVIDTNDTDGKSGNDNRDDPDHTPKDGQFRNSSNTGWIGNTAHANIDKDGEAIFYFRVGMQPGDNYRIVASVIDGSMYAGVQVDDSSEEKYLGPELEENGGAPASPPFTVWRKLWVENDSMDEIPVENGNKRNDLRAINQQTIDLSSAAGANTFMQLTSRVDDASSFFKLEHGRIVFLNDSHPVLGTVVDPIGLSAVSVSGDHTSVPQGTGFLLYDDDDFGLAEAPLPLRSYLEGQGTSRPIVGEQLKNYFKPSFVDVRDAVEFNSNELVQFLRNEDVSFQNPNTVVDDHLQLSDKNDCWVAPVTVAYQGPQGEDQDPYGDDEGFLMGETSGHGEYDSYGYFDHSTVFVETCRENYDDNMRAGNASNQPGYLKKFLIATAAHEIGHQPANESADSDHYEGGLMGKPIQAGLPTMENAKFSASSVLRFRKAKRWSK